MEVVVEAWSKPVTTVDVVLTLHIKLSRAAQAMRRWHKEESKKARAMSLHANDLIFRLDLAQEQRGLSAEEVEFRRFLKAKLLGLAVVERAKWRQRSRITWIKAGDASTKLFHLKANGRRRKNHIPSLIVTTGRVSKHELKEEILFDHFAGLMGTSDHRKFTFE